ncbi:hypothetical protein Goe19_01250 [Bacillus phage vB_BsuM-Goe19]|nr:hypothetical protein Goe19_01250 [Bacillus phage vB_BsuM-Goe19]
MSENTLPKYKPVKKPVLKENKFLNLSKSDWKEANELSKNSRGISGITYHDIRGN